jgi:hemoglobin-like flavoprotein
MMTADQVQSLRESFARIEQQADIAALVFYREVFTLAPELRPMFSTSIELQGRKLMDSLRHTVATLEKPDELVPVLEALGRRHLSYGTKEEHYPVITRAMMRMFVEVLGKQFTTETAAAWDEALKFVVATMQRGARDSGGTMQSIEGRNRN